jgi:hypothetical protein
MSRVLDLGGASSSNFDPLPAGIYNVAITDYEWKETGEASKHPETEYLNFEFTIQDGDHEDRRLWTNCMLPPYDPFMLKGLVSACEGSGVASSSTFDLDAWLGDAIGKTCAAVVKIRKATEEYEASNEIKRFKEKGAGKTSGAATSLMP